MVCRVTQHRGRGNALPAAAGARIADGGVLVRHADDELMRIGVPQPAGYPRMMPDRPKRVRHGIVEQRLSCVTVPSARRSAIPVPDIRAVDGTAPAVTSKKRREQPGQRGLSAAASTHQGHTFSFRNRQVDVL